MSALCAWLAFASGGLAHDPGLSTANGEVSATRLSITTGFAPADAQIFLPSASRTGAGWTQVEFDAAREQLLAMAPRLWEVRAGGHVLPSADHRVELLPEDNVSFRVVFTPPPGVDRLTLRAPTLAELPSGHRQFVIITDERGSTLAKKLLSAKDSTLEVPLTAIAGPSHSDAPAAAASAPTFWAFLQLGVEHIWTGYDHLLFLFALLVVCRSFRSIVGIVTCFTLAHSITLALATFEIVTLPSKWVEAAIAASIVFVGAENLWRRGAEPPRRWMLTFAFGLIHGFGFASVLRDLGIGAGGERVVMPLFSFNLGVETGQVAIAGVVLPIVWALRKRPWFTRWAVPALSALVALAGLYWLVERTLL